MNLEDSIKDVISKKLEDGTIEKLVEKQLEEGVNNALGKLFSSYGDVTEIIEKKIKSVMIPYLENYDYSEYIVKLDAVLTEVLKNTTLDNKKILTNFKDLINPQKIDVIKASELYNKWTEFVANNVKTEGLDIDYDDGVGYKPVDVSMDIEYEEERSWSSFEGAKLIFECEHDEEMNFEIRLNRWKDYDKNWDIHYNNIRDINSLRNLNEFEIFLMNLSQNGTKIELDEDYLNDEITPEKEPEPTFE